MPNWIAYPDCQKTYAHEVCRDGYMVQMVPNITNEKNIRKSHYFGGIDLADTCEAEENIKKADMSGTHLYSLFENTNVLSQFPLTVAQLQPVYAGIVDTTDSLRHRLACKLIGFQNMPRPSSRQTCACIATEPKQFSRHIHDEAVDMVQSLQAHVSKDGIQIRQKRFFLAPFAKIMFPFLASMAYTCLLYTSPSPRDS